MNTTELNATVCGIPCKICITAWEPYRPAIIRADPGDSCPAEGGEGSWEILDRNGRPALWLTRKLTDDDRERIDAEVFNHMENKNDRE